MFVLKILIFVSLAIRAQKIGKNYRFRHTVNKEDCPAGADKWGRGLKPHRDLIVVYNRKTRLITRRQWYHSNFDRINELMDMNIKKNLTKYGIGVFVSFLRGDQERRNESPTTNFYLKTAKLFNGTQPPEPGTGEDFSRMYFEVPFIPRYEVHEYDKKSGRKGKTILLQTGSKCAQTGVWIANEMFYKMDVETNEWTPIYYQPDQTDFYY
ncbi:hypothetical protein OSTOST_21566 [Ostertagia ostertagi]